MIPQPIPSSMKIFVKIVLFLGTSLLLSLIIIICTFVTIEPTSTSHRQVLGDMLWLSAPDGSIGIKIVDTEHPEYTIKVTCNTPDNTCYEGKFIYTGTKLEIVTLDNIGTYLGINVELLNGESLEPFP